MDGGGRRSSILETGTPTSVGSLPHLQSGEAVALVLRVQPELPTLPQLPGRSVLESMLPQVAVGMGGVVVEPDGGLSVSPGRVCPVEDGAPLDEGAWATLDAFLDAASTVPRLKAVKVQLAGPVTLALALVHGGVAPGRAFAAAGATVRSRARALAAEVRRRLPGVGIVAVLDEPGLTAFLAPGFPAGVDATIDLMSGALVAFGADVVTGIHCCGPTDWRLVIHAGPDLISLPVDAGITDDSSGLTAFLERGGWIAWGAVPTDRPIGEKEDPHWRGLSTLWCDLARAGCDPGLLRTQALVTPACGLAGHGSHQVEQVLRLTRRVAERVQDQAIAARLSAGA